MIYTDRHRQLGLKPDVKLRIARWAILFGVMYLFLMFVQIANLTVVTRQAEAKTALRDLIYQDTYGLKK